jgi:hypothetical protein
MFDLLEVDPKTNPAAELAQLISEISERTICAGWEMGIEYEAWGWVLARPTAPFTRMMDEVLPSEVDRMRELSEQLGGWVHWTDDSPNGPSFVPMGEWLKLCSE